MRGNSDKSPLVSDELWVFSPEVAPILFGRDLARAALSHKIGCYFWCSGSPLVGASTPAHSTRCVCPCLDAFAQDKQGVLELYSRELLTDAFLCLLSVARTHGVNAILQDPPLLQIVAKYDHLSHYYQIIQSWRPLGWSTTGFTMTLPTMTEESYNDDRIAKCLSLGTWQELISKWRTIQGNMYHCQEQMNFSQAPWIEASNTPNYFSAAFKLHPHSNRRAMMRIEAKLPGCSLEDILAVVSNVDKTCSWVPYITFPFKMGLREAKCIRRSGRLEVTSLYRMDLPWPIGNRELYLHGWMIDDLDEHGALVVGLRGLNADYPLHPSLAPLKPPPPENPKYKSIYSEGACILKPLPNEKSLLLRVCWCVDLKTSIPKPLVAFACRRFIRISIDSIKKACDRARTDPDWTEMDTWLFEHIRNRLNKT